MSNILFKLNEYLSMNSPVLSCISNTFPLTYIDSLYNCLSFVIIFEHTLYLEFE